MENSWEQYQRVTIEGEKSLEAGIIPDAEVDTIYLRYNFPDEEKNLTIVMTEMEALAIVHMLSGVIIATLTESVDEYGYDPGSGTSGNGNGPQELGPGYPGESAASNN